MVKRVGFTEDVGDDHYNFWKSRRFIMPESFDEFMRIDEVKEEIKLIADKITKAIVKMYGEDKIDSDKIEILFNIVNVSEDLCRVEFGLSAIINHVGLLKTKIKIYEFNNWFTINYDGLNAGETWVVFKDEKVALGNFLENFDKCITENVCEHKKSIFRCKKCFKDKYSIPMEGGKRNRRIRIEEEEIERFELISSHIETINKMNKYVIDMVEENTGVLFPNKKKASEAIKRFSVDNMSIVNLKALIGLFSEPTLNKSKADQLILKMILKG